MGGRTRTGCLALIFLLALERTPPSTCTIVRVTKACTGKITLDSVNQSMLHL
jgi:hypothetical protein